MTIIGNEIFAGDRLFVTAVGTCPDCKGKAKDDPLLRCARCGSTGVWRRDLPIKVVHGAYASEEACLVLT